MRARLSTGRARLDDALHTVGYFVIGLLLHLIVPEIAVYWDGAPMPPFWAFLGWLLLATLGESQRRTRPVLGLAVGCVALVGMAQLAFIPLGIMLIVGDLLFCSVRYTSRRTSSTVAAGTAAVAVTAALAGLLFAGGRAAILVGLNLGLVLAVPVLWAREVRLHAERAEAERERADQARRMAELDRAAAVAAERARMARDLHDVIAGQLSGIALQSEAALTLPDPDPATLRRVLTAVRRDSVASLSEMRAMIGLLRADGSADEPRTAPTGLDHLATLLDTARGTGLRIEVSDERPADRPVPAAVDLAAYRIVQESLTNAAKHAPGSTVRLALRMADDDLVIELINDLVDAPPGGGTGTGLLGLEERARTVGGALDAGPHGRSWRVRAVLPVPVPEGAAR